LDELLEEVDEPETPRVRPAKRRSAASPKTAAPKAAASARTRRKEAQQRTGKYIPLDKL
jgi:hypothetical protein